MCKREKKRAFRGPHKNIFKAKAKTRVGGVNLGRRYNKISSDTRKEYEEHQRESALFFIKMKKGIRKTGEGVSWLRSNIFTNTVNIWILIVALMALSVYVRMGPATIPATDNWAENTLLNNIQSNIAAQIRQQRDRKSVV